MTNSSICSTEKGRSLQGQDGAGNANAGPASLLSLRRAGVSILWADSQPPTSPSIMLIITILHPSASDSQRHTALRRNESFNHTSPGLALPPFVRNYPCIAVSLMTRPVSFLTSSCGRCPPNSDLKAYALTSTESDVLTGKLDLGFTELHWCSSWVLGYREEGPNH